MQPTSENAPSSEALSTRETNHEIHFSDSRSLLESVDDETVQLVVTSPPYWNAKDYNHRNQIGFNQSYRKFSDSLMKVWRESVRTLLPDGKIAINIGNIYCDVAGDGRKSTANLMNLVWNQLRSLPDLRFMGTIYWEKSTSRNHKVLMGSYPYPSSFLISTSLEAIFVFRKIGRRKVEGDVRELSKITLEQFRAYRQPLWRINGVHSDHPAPYPSELPRRLVRMYSFVGDTIMDPFLGSGTTLVESALLGRNCLGIEINRSYFPLMKRTILKNRLSLPLSQFEFFDNNRRPIARIPNRRVRNGI